MAQSPALSDEEIEKMKAVGEWAMYHQYEELFEACCEYFENHGIELDSNSRFSIRAMFYGCRKALRMLEADEVNEVFLSQVSAHIAHLVST